jgi:glutathione S-transferase
MLRVTLVLYSSPVSGNALKVRFLLAELGLDYDTVEVPFDDWPRPDWYLELNPVGRIPTIRDGDLVLAESNAILRYLAAREQRDDLYPTELRPRARVDWLLDAWSTVLRPALFPLERAAGLLGPRDEALVEQSKPAAAAALDVVEELVADNGTMTGAFTIADVCAAPALFRSGNLPLPVDFARWPKLARIRDLVTARPAFLAANPVR